MSSILTNTGAMVALQTLKGINTSLSTTQNEIATGKKVGSAKDNSAVWAISKVMEADVRGFRGISESLSLGESTVSVGRQASETITDLLTSMKGMIVAAQEENVDRSKIQTDIGNLRDQINSVVNAAQFNGLNLVKGFDDVNILSSLDRAADGTVTTSNIVVARQDLSTDAGEFGEGDSLAANMAVDGLDAGDMVASRTETLTIGGPATAGGNDLEVVIGGNTATIDIVALDTAADIATAIEAAVGAAALADPEAWAGISVVANGDDLEVTISGALTDVAFDLSDVDAVTGVTITGGGTGSIDATAATVTFDGTADVEAGHSYRVTINDVNYDYIAAEGDTFENVAEGLALLLNESGIAGIQTSVTEDSGDWTLAVATTATGLSFEADGAEGGSANGGLFALNAIDVTTADGATDALQSIEGMIQTAIDSSAAFGSVQGRIEIQSEFVGKLTDSLRAGIGTLVDADMEETSARLQALQVQQQLAIQSLSIANQAPQNILALFR